MRFCQESIGISETVFKKTNIGVGNESKTKIKVLRELLLGTQVAATWLLTHSGLFVSGDIVT